MSNFFNHNFRFGSQRRRYERHMPENRIINNYPNKNHKVRPDYMPEVVYGMEMPDDEKYIKQEIVGELYGILLPDDDFDDYDDFEPMDLYGIAFDEPEEPDEPQVNEVPVPLYGFVQPEPETDKNISKIDELISRIDALIKMLEEAFAKLFSK